MSYEFYKILHLLGVMTLFLALGFLIVAYTLSAEIQKKFRKLGGALHGVALLVMLVSGFGLAARLGFMSGLPPFIHVKLLIWLLMGAVVIIFKRKPQWLSSHIALVLTLGLLAAYLGVTKNIF